MVISNAKVMGLSNLPILCPVLSSKFYSISFCKHMIFGRILGPNFAIFHFDGTKCLLKFVAGFWNHGTNYFTNILDLGESPLPPRLPWPGWKLSFFTSPLTFLKGGSGFALLLMSLTSYLSLMTANLLSWGMKKCFCGKFFTHTTRDGGADCTAMIYTEF